MPTRIMKLGAPLDRAAKRIACGANHCVALVVSSSAPRAALLRPLLRHALSRLTAPVPVSVRPIDLSVNALTSSLPQESLEGSSTGNKVESEIVEEVSGNNGDDKDNPWNSGCDVALSFEADSTNRVFPCHRVLLEARCPYLRGALNAAAADAPTDENTVTQILGSHEANRACAPLSLSLVEPDASTPTVAALLVYLYCDCLDYYCPPHKLQQLARLADALFLPRLSLLARMAGRASLSNGPETLHVEHELLKSNFDADLERIFERSSNADVRFFVTLQSSSNGESDTELWAHRIFLDSVPYFRALLSERFKQTNNDNGGDSESSAYTDGFLNVDVTGLALDGVRLTTLRLVLRFVYAGSSTALPDHPDDLTGNCTGIPLFF